MASSSLTTLAGYHVRGITVASYSATGAQALDFLLNHSLYVACSNAVKRPLFRVPARQS